MLKLTTGQYLAISIGILGAIAGGSAQLAPIFGPGATHLIVSIATALITIVVAPVLVVITGQSSIVRTVQAMEGVDKIVVNRDANQVLAQLAVDPAQAKIETAPGDSQQVNRTATNG